jgi:nucleoside 2-deoxyribosyltransferase
MKVYFACSISGGRQDEEIYQKIVQTLLTLGISVPTAHIAETGIEEIDALEEAQDIYQRDVQWINESDLLIAEVTTPSHGVGYEIGYALDQGMPVLCLYNHEAVVSKMITGNPHPLLSVYSYQNWPHAEEILRNYIKGFQDQTINS